MDGPTIPPEFERTFTDTQRTIADAATRVIARQGFDIVSVRTVAEESGLHPGTIQYHFPTRQDLLLGALIRSVQRQLDRMQSQPPVPTYFEALHNALLELLPVDDVRREDAVLWVAFGAAASTRSWLADIYWDALQVFRASAERILANAEADGALQPGITPLTGSRLLAALVNGLTIDFINAPADQRDHLGDDLAAGMTLILRSNVPISRESS